MDRSAAPTISVVVADDSFLMREAVSRLVDDEPDLSVVATARDEATLLAAVEDHSPQVVVTDVRMPPGCTDDGVRVAEALRVSNPGCAVVLLSQYVRREYAVRLLRGGAAGRAYLLKDRVAEAGELAGAIRTVAAGWSVEAISATSWPSAVGGSTSPSLLHTHKSSISCSARLSELSLHLRAPVPVAAPGRVVLGASTGAWRRCIVGVCRAPTSTSTTSSSPR